MYYIAQQFYYNDLGYPLKGSNGNGTGQWHVTFQIKKITHTFVSLWIF